MSATVNPALASLPASRREILEGLKRSGEADAETIAARLAMTPSGARQHLTALERDGLVRHQVARDGPGRPRHLYALSEAADALYPRTYADLTNELLEYVEADDPALLGRIFERRRRRRLERARARLDGKPFDERVAELARILDEDGYLAEHERLPDGSYRVVEHNCAVLDVAQASPVACQAELELFQELLGTEVHRERHIASGDRCCEYRVGPPD